MRMNEYNVRVTGTQFNVRNYSNENLATTLVEGRVQIERKGRVDRLRPGQQAILENNEIRIRTVNVNEQVAWRHGAFGFTQCRLENIMEELARWYDVEIQFADNEIGKVCFTGAILKFRPLEDLLDMIEVTSRVQYRREGKILLFWQNK